MSYFYILEINPLSVALVANIFSHFEGCLFILFLSLIRSHLLFFKFYYSRRWIKKDLAAIYVKKCSAYSTLSFIVFSLTFRSLIHFEFIFVYGVRKCSNFILLHVAVQFS